jgi:hypothetical protein
MHPTNNRLDDRSQQGLARLPPGADALAMSQARPDYLVFQFLPVSPNKAFAIVFFAINQQYVLHELLGSTDY